MYPRALRGDMASGRMSENSKNDFFWFFGGEEVIKMRPYPKLIYKNVSFIELHFLTPKSSKLKKKIFRNLRGTLMVSGVKKFFSPISMVLVSKDWQFDSEHVRIKILHENLFWQYVGLISLSSFFGGYRLVGNFRTHSIPQIASSTTFSDAEK